VPAREVDADALSGSSLPRRLLSDSAPTIPFAVHSSDLIRALTGRGQACLLNSYFCLLPSYFISFPRAQKSVLLRLGSAHPTVYFLAAHPETLA
jgi:hypothetical protein